MPGSRATAASRMLDVAVARIAAEGLSVSLDSVRMEQVIEEAGVSRATAYRRWPTRDDFLADVLVETVRRTTLIPETPDDVARILGVVSLDPARLLDAQARRDVAVEALRVSADLDVRRILASPAWRTYHALASGYEGLAGRVRDEVGRALVATSHGFDDRRAEIYANLAALFGYRFTDPAGPAPLAQAAGAMMTGIVTRALYDREWLDARAEATLFGASAPAPWSMPERHLVGVVLAGMEPDPAVAWTPERVRQQLATFDSQLGELMALPSSPVAAP